MASEMILTEPVIIPTPSFMAISRLLEITDSLAVFVLSFVVIAVLSAGESVQV